MRTCGVVSPPRTDSSLLGRAGARTGNIMPHVSQHFTASEWKDQTGFPVLTVSTSHLDLHARECVRGFEDDHDSAIAAMHEMEWFAGGQAVETDGHHAFQTSKICEL